MKALKVIAALLVMVILAALCSCATKTSEQPVVDVPAVQNAGGWTVPQEFVALGLPEDAQTAFDKAVGGLTGNNLEPLALLGTQVVAGTNYSILCKSTLVTAQPIVAYKVAVVYADLNGGAELLNIADFNAADYTKTVENNSVEALTGGWTVNRDFGTVTLPENVQEAFDKAASANVGVGYHPVAYLGSQVVAGANYSVLCRATIVTANPIDYLTVVTVYEDLNGGAEFTAFHPVNLGDFTK